MRLTPRLSCVGVHLFAHWRDQHGAFDPVVARLPQAIQAHAHAHPDADVALVHPQEQTLRRRFQALCFAPVFGVDTLTRFDTHEHPLGTLRGRGYHSATLGQFLGQRERLDAAEALRPALVPDKAGQITSVDGHMIASWSRVSMHKGTITVLGRIMAGSQAVMAPNDTGHAVLVTEYPPDMPLSQILVAYGQTGGAATGSVLCGIDRAVNAVAMACAVDDQDVGVISMRDDNAHDGLASCEATSVGPLAEGTPV